MNTDTDLNSLDSKRLFSLGQCLITPGIKALMECTEFPIITLIHRHQSGDWGDLCPEDQQENEFALHNHLRIFSAYQLTFNNETIKIWIITEADRSATTVLLPSEY